MVIRTAGLALFILAVAGCASRQKTTDMVGTHHPRVAQFTVNGHSLHPEIARDDDDRARGLQHRQPPQDGLILLFPNSMRQSIWMPNCPVDLEGWVIDDQGGVLQIMELPAEPEQRENESLFQYHARLPRHRADEPSRIIWEFESGTAAELGVRPGQTIEGDWDLVIQNDSRVSATQ